MYIYPFFIKLLSYLTGKFWWFKYKWMRDRPIISQLRYCCQICKLFFEYKELAVLLFSLAIVIQPIISLLVWCVYTSAGAVFHCIFSTRPWSSSQVCRGGTSSVLNGMWAAHSHNSNILDVRKQYKLYILVQPAGHPGGYQISDE